MINNIKSDPIKSGVIRESATVDTSVEVDTIVKPTNNVDSAVTQLESEVKVLDDKSKVLGQYDHIVIAKAEVDAQFAKAKAEYSAQVSDGDLTKDGKKYSQDKLELYAKVQSLPFHTLMASESLQRFAMDVSAAYKDNPDALTKGVEKKTRSRREELSMRQNALFAPKFNMALAHLTSDGEWASNDELCQMASNLCSDGDDQMKAAGTVYFTKSEQNGVKSTYSGSKTLVELLLKDGEFTSVPNTMVREGLIQQQFVEAGDGERKGRKPVYRMIQDKEDIL